jgi:hypothetical protein
MSMSLDPSGSHNSSISVGDDESPFFADITLDLAEAHDIAETPEPRKFVSEFSMENTLKMPPISDSKVSSPLSPLAAFPSPAPVPPVKGMITAPYADDTTSTMKSDLEQQAQMRSITNSQEHGRVAMAYNKSSTSQTPSSKRWPRDIQWAVAFCIIVPLSLVLPMIFAKSPNNNNNNKEDGDDNNPTENWLSTVPAPRLATLHTLLWGYVASLVLSRLLYRTMGGGDGDDARHVASQILLASAPISVSVYICLIVAMYFMTPHAMHYAVVPLWFLARDLYLFRSWKMTATTPGGRQAFFQALTCMTLDILSRSLRRSSFYRIVSFLLVVQLIVIAWWRWALLAALRSQSVGWILMAALGGKWATGTVARLLSLIASGGISSWFSEQNSLVEGLQQQKDHEDNQEEEMIEFASISNSNYKSDDEDDIPEAYRTADASAYKSVLVPDEGMDDDFDDEYEEGDALQSNNNSILQAPRGSTVKQLLFTGLTISFGSVAKCGLLGGLAQFMWSQLRKIDTARATIGNLQGMSIGAGGGGEESVMKKYMLQANILAREFVRSHSDMAMSHVAAFQKSYFRAAQDVATLIDGSGM